MKRWGKLSIPVGMLLAFHRLAIGLEAEALSLEQLTDLDTADLEALRVQLAGE